MNILQSPERRSQSETVLLSQPTCAETRPGHSFSSVSIAQMANRVTHMEKMNGSKKLAEHGSFGKSHEDTQEGLSERQVKPRQETKPSLVLPDAETGVVPLSQQAWTDSQIQQLVAGPSQLSQGDILGGLPASQEPNITFTQNTQDSQGIQALMADELAKQASKPRISSAAALKEAASNVAGTSLVMLQNGQAGAALGNSSAANVGDGAQHPLPATTAAAVAAALANGDLPIDDAAGLSAVLKAAAAAAGVPPHQLSQLDIMGHLQQQQQQFYQPQQALQYQQQQLQPRHASVAKPEHATSVAKRRGPMDEMRQLQRILTKLLPKSAVYMPSGTDGGGNKVQAEQIKVYLAATLGDAPKPDWGLKHGWGQYLADLFNWATGRNDITNYDAMLCARRQQGRSWEVLYDQLINLGVYSWNWDIPLQLEQVRKCSKEPPKELQRHQAALAAATTAAAAVAGGSAGGKRGPAAAVPPAGGTAAASSAPAAAVSAPAAVPGAAQLTPSAVVSSVMQLLTAGAGSSAAPAAAAASPPANPSAGAADAPTIGPALLAAVPAVPPPEAAAAAPAANEPSAPPPSSLAAGSASPVRSRAAVAAPSAGVVVPTTSAAAAPAQAPAAAAAAAVPPAAAMPPAAPAVAATAASAPAERDSRLSRLVDEFTSDDWLSANFSGYCQHLTQVLQQGVAMCQHVAANHLHDTTLTPEAATTAAQQLSQLLTQFNEAAANTAQQLQQQQLEQQQQQQQLQQQHAAQEAAALAQPQAAAAAAPDAALAAGLQALLRTPAPQLAAVVNALVQLGGQQHQQLHVAAMPAAAGAAAAAALLNAGMQDRASAAALPVDLPAAAALPPVAPEQQQQLHHPAAAVDQDDDEADDAPVTEAFSRFDHGVVPLKAEAAEIHPAAMLPYGAAHSFAAADVLEHAAFWRSLMKNNGDKVGVEAAAVRAQQQRRREQHRRSRARRQLRDEIEDEEIFENGYGDVGNGVVDDKGGFAGDADVAQVLCSLSQGHSLGGGAGGAAAGSVLSSPTKSTTNSRRKRKAYELSAEESHRD